MRLRFAMTNGSEPRIRQIRTVRDTADFWLKATRSAWVVQPEFPWRRLEVEADLVHRDQPTTVLPDLQHFLMKRMGATTHAVDSCHVPMPSHPSLASTLFVPPQKLFRDQSTCSVRRISASSTYRANSNPP